MKLENLLIILPNMSLCLCWISVAALAGAGLWSQCDSGPHAASLRGLSRLLVGAAAALSLLVRHGRATHRYATLVCHLPSNTKFRVGQKRSRVQHVLWVGQETGGGAGGSSCRIRWNLIHRKIKSARELLLCLLLMEIPVFLNLVGIDPMRVSEASLKHREATDWKTRKHRPSGFLLKSDQSSEIKPIYS